MHINIQSIHFHADDKLVNLIHKKLSKLESYFSRITDIEVHLKLDGEGSHIKDKMVQIKLNLPKGTVISKETTKTFEESLDLAIGSLKTQLKKYKDKMNSKERVKE